MRRLLPGLLLLLPACASAPAGAPGRLPGLYFRMMEAGLKKLESPATSSPPNTSHHAAATLCAAVLHVRAHPDNPSFGDPAMLARAKEYGDLLAVENEAGRFQKRLDNHRNTYLWLEAYRILEPKLEEDRRTRWRREIQANVKKLAADTAERADYPRYASPYILTSPNHYSLWASTTYLAGIAFEIPEWEETGRKVLRRFATEEQAPDGYWGEHSRAGPTTGYDYLTLTGVALYYEHSKDPAALEALRRNTTFHKYFTYPDGKPVEVVNDRNRHWGVSPWGHFGFSHFPDGRRYAEFLTGFLEKTAGMVSLGRIAQDALYFHDGPTAPIPQDVRDSAYRMRVPASIRRRGPWTVCLSALIATQAVKNRFYLDRQGHISVFHEKLGLIVTGANSKRQPEVATFTEKFGGNTYHLPTSSRLRISPEGDLLSLAYNTFFADIECPVPSDTVSFDVRVTRMASGEERTMNLQLKLHAGEALEIGSSKFTVGTERIEGAAGVIRHHGWTLNVDREAKLAWPVYPFNPYRNGPESSLEHAVAVLSIPIRPEKAPPGKRLRTDRVKITVGTDPSR